MQPLTEKDCDLAADFYMRKNDPLHLRRDRHFSAEESESFGIRFSIQIFLLKIGGIDPPLLKILNVETISHHYLLFYWAKLLSMSEKDICRNNFFYT